MLKNISEIFFNHVFPIKLHQISTMAVYRFRFRLNFVNKCPWTCHFPNWALWVRMGDVHRNSLAVDGQVSAFNVFLTHNDGNMWSTFPARFVSGGASMTQV